MAPHRKLEGVALAEARVLVFWIALFNVVAAQQPQPEFQLVTIGECEGCTFTKFRWFDDTPYVLKRDGLCPSCSALNFSFQQLAFLGDPAIPIFPGMKELRNLDVSHNELVVLAWAGGGFQDTPALETLDAAHNRINIILPGTFNGLETLRELSLADNSLTVIALDGTLGNDLSSLQGLRALDLSENFIDRIEPFAFRNLTELQNLSLRGNMLTSLSAETFAGLHDLTELDLSNNPVEFIHDDAFLPLSSLRNLYFTPLNTSMMLSRAFEQLPDTVAIHVLDSVIEYETHRACLAEPGCDFTIVRAGSESSLTRSGNCSCSELFFVSSFITAIDASAFAELPLVKSVTFWNNRLETLPANLFGGLSALEELKLGGNGLTSISRGAFAGLANLTTLDLSYNSLEYLEGGVFDGLHSLSTLVLHHNAIRSLEHVEGGVFDGLHSLSTLQLHHNAIRSLDPFTFRGLSALTKLDLERVGIDELQPEAFCGLDSLAELRLSASWSAGLLEEESNSISRIPAGAFRCLGNLTLLELDGNNISLIEVGAFEGLGRVSEVVLAENEIVTIEDGALEGLGAGSVLSLDLRGNNLGELRRGMFRGLGSVGRLDLSENSVRLTNTSFEELSGVDVQSVDLRGNWMGEGHVAKGTLRGLETLQELDLSENGITSLRAGMFDDVANLRRLVVQGEWLSWNLGFLHRIASIDPEAFRGMDRLEELDLSWSALSSISGALQHLPSLLRLELFKNKLGNIGASSLDGVSANITYLGLRAQSFDGIGGYGFQRLSALKHLDMSDNWILSRGQYSSINAFAGLENLEYLSLAGNQIRELRKLWFAPLASLRELSLHAASILSIEADSFAGLTRLEVLDLSGNYQIHELQAGVFSSLTNVRDLRFGGSSVGSIGSHAMSGLKSLATLNLSPINLNRPDWTLKSLAPQAFAGMASLTLLQLSNNALLQLHADTFAGLPRLTELLVADNQLWEVEAGAFAGLRHLRTLDLSGNQLERLPRKVFEGLVELETLYLNSNHLRHVEPGALLYLLSARRIHLAVNPLACRPVIAATLAGSVHQHQGVYVDTIVNFLPGCIPLGCPRDAGELFGSGGAADAFGTLIAVQSTRTAMALMRWDAVRHIDATLMRQGIVTAQGAGERCFCVAADECYNLSRSAGAVDECLQGLHDCSAHAACTDTLASFHCECGAGYASAGNHSGVECVDADECAEGSHRCGPAAHCLNTIGSFSCSCNPGFQRSEDGRACDDVDECALGLDACNADATCDNTNGSYVCHCNDGFGGDGIECVDVDECSSARAACDANAACNNSVGSFTCTCGAGFTTSDAGATCVDVDECAAAAHACSQMAACVNTNGSFSCVCSPGFQASDAGGGCVDVDECERGGHRCGPHSMCNNSFGSFACPCVAGFTGDGVTGCSDVDECLDTGACDAARGHCTNLPGGFECSCLTGYRSDDGGVQCFDVDECGAGLDNCGHHATCSNSDGSFVCHCNAGFAGDGVGCLDVDECVQGSANCDVNAACRNTDGSFQCSCTAGFAGDGVSCNAAPQITSMAADELVLDARESSVFAVEVAFVDEGDALAHVLSLDWECDGEHEVEVEVAAGGRQGVLALPLAQVDSGVFQVCVRVRDAAAQADEQALQGLVTVYDPTDGFVTAAGAFSFPAADLSPAQLEGSIAGPALPVSTTARIGFFARYFPREVYPRGYLRVVLVGANGRARSSVQFTATTLDWLAVSSEHEAKFQGTGQVRWDGAQWPGPRTEFKFMVTLQDDSAAVPACSKAACDGVRVRVWHASTGAVLFDNQRGAAPHEFAVTALDSGRIRIRVPRDPHNRMLRPLSLYLGPEEGWREDTGSSSIDHTLALAVLAAGSVLLLAGAATAWRARRRDSSQRGAGIQVCRAETRGAATLTVVDGAGNKTALVADLLPAAEGAGRGKGRRGVLQLQGVEDLVTQSLWGVGASSVGDARLGFDSSCPSRAAPSAASLGALASFSPTARARQHAALGASGLWSAGPFAQGSTDSLSLVQDASGVWAMEAPPEEPAGSAAPRRA